MRDKQLTPREFQKRPVRVLANIGKTNSSTHVEVEVDSSSDASIRTVKNWLKQGGCKVLSEGPFRTGPSGLRIWENAFSDYESHDTEFESNRFNIFYDDGTAGPREPSISCSITKATVTLEDGTVKDDVFEVTLSRSAGTPDEVIIMSR